MSRSLVSVADARVRAAKRMERDLREWAVSGGEDALLEVPLLPPSERAVLADQAGVRAWRDSWVGVDGVVWVTRAWPSAGTQRVPERLALAGADQIARFAGRSREWSTARAHARTVVDGLSPGLDDAEVGMLAGVVRTHARRLAAASDIDVNRIVGVVRWLSDNPVDGLRIRHVALRGVDTKWLAAHRAVVEALHAVVSGRLSLGLAEGDPLVRIRILAAALDPGGLRDAAAPSREWAARAIDPAVVLVVENLETLLALEELEGTVAVHGAGYGAAARLRDIPWVGAAPLLLYWGDLDSHGFGILHEFRSSYPHAESILMDEATLLAHRDLWVSEPRPAPMLLGALTAQEAAARSRIAAEGDVRLEQERIPWAYAAPAIRARVAELGRAGQSEK